jgi:hypothetical protein
MSSHSASELGLRPLMRPPKAARRKQRLFFCD